MHGFHRALTALALIIIPVAAHAQTDEVCIAGGVMATRTYTLRALSSADAAKLVSPYLVNACGVVYDGSSRVPALTVVVPRANAAVFGTVDSLLRVFDQLPRAVTLRFQLVVTTDEAAADPRLAEVQQALGSLFSFRGYRLLAEGTTVVDEQESFGLTMSSDQERYLVMGNVGTIQGGGHDSSAVHLSVSLSGVGGHGGDSTASAVGLMAMFPGSQAISTTLTVPIGQTVVLGSGSTDGQSGVLILVVRPELR